MVIRALWLAVPACAAAGAIGVTMVGAQESLPKPAPVPETRAATGMFGPPPPVVLVQSPGQPAASRAPGTFGPPGSANPVRPASGSEPVTPPPLFFPDAPPPPKVVKVEAPVIPAPTIPPPRITVESTPSVSEPKPLPFVPPPIAVLPSATIPPVKVPTGPQPLLPVPGISVMPAAATTTPGTLPFPNLPMTAKQTPSVMIECLAPESVGVGQTLEYVLVVKNAGGTAVANVRIEDEVPVGAKFLSSEPPAELIGDRLAWNMGILEANGEKRIKIIVKPGEEGELRSRAMVSFTAAAEARIKVTRPRITLALVGSENVRVGDEVPFTIKVTNSGSGTASNLLVKAKLSDGLHHPAGTQIEALIDRLPAGETKTITLRAIATKAGANGCNITASSEGLTPEVAAANVAIVEPMLAVKVAGPSRCLVRTEPEFRIELTNPGSAATDPVQMWAVLPEGFEFLMASDAGTFQPANRLVVWNLPAMAMGSNRTLSVKLKATTASEGTLKIVAQSTPAAETGVVTAGAKTSTPRILEVKAETTVRAEGVPALRFEVTDVEDPVEVGKEAIYDIKIVNQGTAPCTNVIVTATLAEGTTGSGATGPTSGRSDGQVVSFDALPQLTVKGEVVYRVKVRGAVAGDLKIKVAVSCDEIRTPTAKEENTRFFKD